MPTHYTSKLIEWLGYLNAEEADLLQDVARKLPTNAMTANIGAGAGTSALAVAEARPDITIWTVDISPSGPLGGLEGERNAFDGAGIKHPNQILGNSKVVGKEWKGDKFDMIFIDADHSEEGIRSDIAAWMPHLKQGGYAVFHDYGMYMWGAVKPVIDELIVPTYKQVGLARWLIAFQSLVPSETKEETKDAPNKASRVVKQRTKSGL